MPNHLFRAWNRESYPAQATQDPLCAEAVASWLKRFPDSQPDSKRDFEDWGEHVSSLVGFDRAGIKEIQLAPSAGAAFVSQSADRIAKNDKGPVGFLYHGFNRSDAITPFEPSTRLIGQDSKTLEFISTATESPAYKHAAGRQIIATGVEPEEIDQAIRKIVGDEGKIFLKTIKKEMSGVYDIKPGGSPWSQICEQDEGLMWAPIQHEGTDRFFLLQECMKPADEYRFHVLGDQVITGSACWVPFVPMHHEPSSLGAFDARLAPDAFCPADALRRDENQVGSYLEFAEKLAKDIKQETGHLMAYTLDVCLDKNDGQVKLIELNPQLNAGRYAADANLWVKTVSDTLVQIENQERQQQIARAHQQQISR